LARLFEKNTSGTVPVVFFSTLSKEVKFKV